MNDNEGLDNPTGQFRDGRALDQVVQQRRDAALLRRIIRMACREHGITEWEARRRLEMSLSVDETRHKRK